MENTEKATSNDRSDFIGPRTELAASARSRSQRDPTQLHIETLRKLRAKMVEQRRTTATRQAGASHSEGYAPLIGLQDAIEAVDRAIADEESLLAASAPHTGIA